MPTASEIEIALRTTYKGDASAKLVSDLDKISASGQRVSNVFQKIGPELKSLYLGANAKSKADLLAQYPYLSSLDAKKQVGGFMPRDSYLRQQANRMMKDISKAGEISGFKGPPLPPILASQAYGKVGGGGGLALAGASGSLVIGAVIAAVALALKALQASIRKTVEAFEQARTLYAKALTSGGLGLQFTQRRASLANILGVGEKEVYQFGQAVLYLTPKVAWANNIIARTTPALAGVAINFKVLENDARALFSTIGSQAAPALLSFSQALSDIIKQMTDFLQKHQKYVQFIAELPNAVLYAVGLGPDGKVVAQRENANRKNPLPAPLAYMKQIQASAFERMGLVVGGIGGQNPAQETARNTKVSAMELAKISRSLGTNRTSYDPFRGTQSYA